MPIRCLGKGVCPEHVDMFRVILLKSVFFLKVRVTDTQQEYYSLSKAKVQHHRACSPLKMDE